MLLMLFFFFLLFWLLHHVFASFQQVDDGLQKLDYFHVYPNHREIRFFFSPLVIAFGYRLSVENDFGEE